METKIIREAEKYWSEEKYIEAGRILYENVPQEERPAWSAKILLFIYNYTNIPKTSEIERVIEIVNSPSNWHEAYEAFQNVRGLTIQFEKRHLAHERLYLCVLLLAENVAKVIYNASGHPAPFDSNSGWWLVSNVKDITKKVDNSKFLAELWELFTS